MIQDILPSRLHNHWQPRTPQPESYIMCFRDGKLLASLKNGELRFPQFHESCRDAVYLFSVDDAAFFLCDADETGDFQFYEMRELRDRCAGKYLYAAFTAYHLQLWYAENRYCGICRGDMVHDGKERALVCQSCGHKIYPRINPAVIVGVIRGDCLLITRYRQGYAHNALIAGFTEIGETLEQTAAREVMEETGVKVKNIRYYKSQPWGTAQDILAGFFCEADGSGEIHMDETELKYAEWIRREDIVLQPDQLSLTNEMMQMFRDGKISAL